MWAGAFPPINTTVLRESLGHARSPAYSNETYNLWSQDWLNYVGPKVRNDLGVFSYSAPLHRSGFLHSDAAAASSLDGSPRLHVKNDNSNFTYVGRSYGIGSLLGLEENDLSLSESVLSYCFHPTIQCIYNQSSAFGLTLLQSSDNLAVPEIYSADGAGLFGDRATFTVVGFGGKDRIVALGVYHVYREAVLTTEAYYAFATGQTYRILDKVQCHVTAVPTKFSVDVDLQRRLITVNPLLSDHVVSIETSNVVIQRAASTPGALSIIDQTYFTSIFGDMFMNSGLPLASRYV